MKTLILLPPSGETDAFWSAQKNYLDDIANVLAFDLTKHDSIETMAQTILDEVEGPFCIAGASLGGWVCFEIIKRASERVEKLCLVHSIAHGVDKTTRDMLAQRIETLKSLDKDHIPDMLETLSVRNIDRFVHPDNQESPAIKDAFNYNKAGRDLHGFINHMSAAISEDLDYSDLLPKITCPTLAIGSHDDKIIPYKDFRDSMEQIPGVKIALIEKTGHVAPLERPEAVTSLLRLWLEYF